MHKRTFLLGILVAVVLAGWAGVAAQKELVLYANFQELPATAVTDKGPQKLSFQGAIGFRVLPTKEGMELVLTDLNLVSKGVRTARGPSGVIGLALLEGSRKVSYDPKTGRIWAELRLSLHYALIDRIKGFHSPPKGAECAVFDPYVEEMVGKLEGRLPEALQPASGTKASFDGVLTLKLDKKVLGAIESLEIDLRLYLIFERLSRVCLTLNIQPVFIGSGPSDPNATGWAFPTLIRNAQALWKKCCSVRCIAFNVLQPIYVDNEAYRVLESSAEAAALRAEVDVDAVEVFVVDHWDPLYDGGGACWSSGTAEAKIVTCDQQLDVPCPPLAGGSCGRVNLFHLAHELGHALSLCHPSGDCDPATRPLGSPGSVMEPSGFYRDNPDVQSAKNCRGASNPLLYWSRTICTGSPDISD